MADFDVFDLFGEDGDFGYDDDVRGPSAVATKAENKEKKKDKKVRCASRLMRKVVRAHCAICCALIRPS